jgi:hypothetical protein
LLGAATRGSDKFDVKRSRETACYCVLRFREICAIGIEPVRPYMRAGLGVYQLYIYPNLFSGSSGLPSII